MERDSNDTFSNPNATGSSGAPLSAGVGAGSSGISTADTGFATGTVDNVVPAADAGTSVRDRAGNIKTFLADALQSSAERLRGGEIQAARGTGASADVVTNGGALAQTSNQLAGGLQGAADWIRDADLDGLQSGIERQVKEHPGRSLAIAVGLGYLLGKAIRR